MKTQLTLIYLMLFSVITFAQSFHDNLANETIGDFPSQWDVVSGMATVDQQDGYKLISLLHGGIIKPIINDETDNYLSEDFTVEFDIFFDQTSSLYGQRFQLRLWNGAYGYQNEGIRYKPFIIYRSGVETDWNHPEQGNAKNYIKQLETLDPVWRHVKVECKSGKLKMYLDDRMVLNFPRFKMQPSMVSIGGGINDSQYIAKIGFTNFTITGLNSTNTSSTTSNDSHTESEIITTNPYNPSPTDTDQESNTSTSNTNTDSNNTQQTGAISSTINTPNGITQDTTIDENVGFDPIDTSTVTPLDSIAIQQPYDPIYTTTNPQILTPELLDEEPIYILKVTLTDLLCIKKRNNFRPEADYRLIQEVKYIAEHKSQGKLKLGYMIAFDYIQNNFFIRPDRYHLGRGDISLIETGKKESNIMNSLFFELRQTNINDKSASFLIHSHLIDRANSSLNEDKLLYYGDIEVDIYDILADLILLKEGKQLQGYSVPFHDPEIMKAQYGLFKTFDSGPNGKLWVRQVGNTLEGPISLGNTTSNNGLRGAAWIKFELLEY